MSEVRRAADGHFYAFHAFVTWYGWHRGHKEWAQAGGIAGGSQGPGASVEEPLSGAVEPGAGGLGAEARRSDGGAEKSGAKEVKPGAGAAEHSVCVGTPGAGARFHEWVESATSADERDLHQLTLVREEQQHREQLLSLLMRDLEQEQRRKHPWSQMAREWEQQQQKEAESGAGAAEPGVCAGTPGAVVGEVDVPTTPIPVAGAEGHRTEDAGAHTEGLGAGDEDGVCSSSPEHVHTLKEWLKDWRWRGEGARYLLVHHVGVGEEPYFYDRIAGVRIHTVPTGEPYEHLF